MSEQKSPPLHPPYRPDIDGLRAIAVVSVVLFHAFPSSLTGGFIGVDVFFIISGYLISNVIFLNLQQNRFSFIDFYQKRIRRIFPALVLVLSFTLLFGAYALTSEELKSLSKHILGGVGFISNFILWQEIGYFDKASELKPLLHLWSLGIEEQFYIFWPLILALLWKKRVNIFAATILFTLASFILNIKGVHTNPGANFYLPQSRVWEILLGSLLAWITLYKETSITIFKEKSGQFFSRFHSQQTANLNYINLSNSYFSIIGTLFIFIGLLIVKKGSAFPGYYALLPTLGTVFIIFSGAEAYVNKKILSHKALIWIGLISYPLYLWHWPLLSFANIIEEQRPSELLRALLVILSVALSYLTYKFVEIPLRFKTNKNTSSLGLIVAILIVGAAGFIIFKKDGLPNRARIADYEREINQIKYEQDLGRPAEAHVMLLGDSHAAHFVPGLKHFFGTEVADYTSPGCIPFYGVDRYDSRSKPGECLSFISESLSLFEKSTTLNTIILTSMGPVYLDGTAFKGQDLARVTGLGVTLEGSPDLKDRWQIYEIGMRNTLSRLLKARKNIVFILDTPEIGFDPKQCLAKRPLQSKKSTMAVCAVSRKDYIERAQQYRALVQNILKDFPQVLFFDPTLHLCDENWCYAKTDGNILYRDIDHLSNAGSLYIVKHLEPLIRNLIHQNKNHQ